MQQQQQTATLTTVFSEVLANLAFMFTDTEPGEPVLEGEWLETMISYHGPYQGTLRLRCTRAFTVLLAANLLGIDPDDDEAEHGADDAAKEFMNIVCGQLVTTLHGTDPVFNLSIPRSTPLAEPPDLYSEDVSTTSTLWVEGHPVQLVYAAGPPTAGA
ncbi:MAG TPA: chemotaxis protein CheX [Phycisphaerae bacterium]|nr:chemotaxis protein CheX [Phycisphaerae bacterium]HNU46376.1 chemotaxis protein CheX [Phycisphaerae bacterium]